MTTIQIRRGVNASIGSLSLLSGEPAFVTDTGKLYIGNGSDKILINPTLGSAADATLGTAAGNVPVLDANGKLPDSTMPNISITDVFVVGSEAEMLALTAETGDVAVRTDVSKSFILKTQPATSLANWQEILSPVGGLVSVNGKTGTVVLSGEDIAITGYTIASTPTALAATDTINAALGKLEKIASLKAPLESPAFTGVPSAPTAIAATNTTQLATTAFVQTALGVIDGGIF